MNQKKVIVNSRILTQRRSTSKILESADRGVQIGGVSKVWRKVCGRLNRVRGREGSKAKEKRKPT